MRVIEAVKMSGDSLQQIKLGDLITHKRKVHTNGCTNFYYYKIYIGDRCVNHFFIGDIRKEKTAYGLTYGEATDEDGKPFYRLKKRHRQEIERYARHPLVDKGWYIRAE